MSNKPPIWNIVRNLSDAERRALERYLKSEAFEGFLDVFMNLSEEQRVQVIDEGRIETIAEQAAQDIVEKAAREWLTEKGYLK